LTASLNLVKPFYQRRKKMKKTLSAIIALSSVLVLVLCAGALAEPQSIPNGPWIQDNQQVQLNALMSNEELEKTLYQIEARAKGRMTVEVGSYSTTGLPIFLVKFGEADELKLGVLIEGQIHGGGALGCGVLRGVDQATCSQRQQGYRPDPE